MNGHAVMHTTAPGAWAHVPVALPAPVLAGVGLVAAATVTGAWLARRRGQRQIWFAAAAGALLIVAGLHLLPDAWAAAYATGIRPALVPVAAAAGFAVAGRRPTPGAPARSTSSRRAARPPRRHWRFTGSWRAPPSRWPARRRSCWHWPRTRSGRVWLPVRCSEPASPPGSGLAGIDVPEPGDRRRRHRHLPCPGGCRTGAARPGGGVLGQAARVSGRAAFCGLRPARLLLSRPAAATTMAAIVTALAVHAVG